MGQSQGSAGCGCVLLCCVLLCCRDHSGFHICFLCSLVVVLEELSASCGFNADPHVCLAAALHVGLVHLILGGPLQCCAGSALCERTGVLRLQERQGFTWTCVSRETPYNVEYLHASTLVPNTCSRGSTGEDLSAFQALPQPGCAHTTQPQQQLRLKPTCHCASQPHSAHASLGCCHQPASLTHSLAASVLPQLNAIALAQPQHHAHSKRVRLQVVQGLGAEARLAQQRPGRQGPLRRSHAVDAGG